MSGIELRQAVLCFDGSQGLARCPDNSLPLVANKGTAHMLRQTRHQVQRQDWEAVRQGLKAVLEAPDRETARARFAVFQQR